MKSLVVSLMLVLTGMVEAASLDIRLVTEASQARQHTTFAGIVVEPQRSMERAIRLAIKESELKFSQYDLDVSFTQVAFDSSKSIAQQLDDLSASSLVILDLSAERLSEVAPFLDQAGAVAVNAALTDENLRDQLCLPGLYHSIPSDRMYFDALSQYLIHSGWRKVLLVHGTSTEDMQRKTLLAKSIERFGGSVVDERPFSLSHHPDDRDKNRPEFLTGGSSYDVVAVIDSARDYGRKVEYSTRRPRPVVGDVGLVPRAWHFALERYGAPQLNERYRTEVEPPVSDPRVAMTDAEFAAWAAIKLVSNSLGAHHLEQGGLNLRTLFSDPEARVDLYKGTRGSYRAWNHQLRHPILLTSANYVVDLAPMPKFLHPSHYVDTLGADKPESACQLGG